MPNFKESFPHIASIHDAKGKPAFSVILLMPKTDIPVLIKKEDNSSGDSYYYSFSIDQAVKTGFKKPDDEYRKKFDGFLGMNRKEIVHFIIPTDNEGASEHSHAHLYIANILSSNTSQTKEFFMHKGTIHFPGGPDI